MTIPANTNPLLLKAPVSAGVYTIERSVRFNSGDSAYLNATLGTPTDQDVFTLSMWVKRSTLGSTQQLFGCSTDHSFGFTSGDALNLTFGGSSALTTTELFRDPSAWYHIVWEQNANAHELYVNGASVGTATATSNTFNTAVAHQIGAANTTNYFDGYLADIQFIDGQALDPTSFGEFDATTGVWIPIRYTGSYGANGFHLDLSDNSTAAALGTDTSGSSNTWTVNNISVTAGTGNDSLVDSPSDGTQTDSGVGGEVVGNYCTWNYLDRDVDVILTNGNLDMAQSAAGAVRGTFGLSSDKWYWEVTAGTGNTSIGVIKAETSLNSYVGSNVFAVGWAQNGNFFVRNVTLVGSGLDTYTTNDIIGCALDMDAGTIEFYKNGSLHSRSASGLTGTWFPAIGTNVSATASPTNFGQRPYAYTSPSGFKALCTVNLPEGTITTSGSFTGNANANGPFVWLNGVPTAMTINSNAVTFATDADKLSNGFKLRTSSSSYNTAGTNTYSVTTTGDKFKYARAQPNP
jgi:hypothetical protein